MHRSLLVTLLLAAACSNEAPSPTPEAPADTPAQASAPPTTTPLASALGRKKQASAKKGDPAIKKSFQDAIDALGASGILDRAKQTGATAPDFTLPNAKGGTTSLAELRKTGPVVVLWYRGGWCPYCNLTLHAYQEQLPSLQAAGAQLVAISPETPDRSMNTAEKNALAFEVLSDTTNATARDYGVLFEVPADVWAIYEDKLAVGAYYSHDRPELPLAATYVIAQDGTIAWHFLSADYRERAEPADVLAAVKALSAP